MYHPDGFASLACALHGQCSFLSWQQPFIQLMHLINGNIYLFFGLQALLWFALIGLIYFLCKTLKIKHLFLTPFILLFSTSFFIDNFIGNLENDSFGIILILIAMIYGIKYYEYLKYNKNCINKKHGLKPLTYLWISITSFITSLSYWMWIGHLPLKPKLWSMIVEEVFWVHWFSFLFLFYIILFIFIKSIKQKNYWVTGLITIIMLAPKLFIFITPLIIKELDKIISFIYTKPNHKFLFTIIVLGLLIGQGIRVGYLTHESWTREIEDEQCVLVNDEYFLRATKGLNYSYNQLSIKELESCKQKT